MPATSGADMGASSGVDAGSPGVVRSLRIAVIGAGPVGLSLALHAARALPDASITLFDSRPVGVDPARDPRTLALSLGSIQLLQRLKTWTPEACEPITAVHVSQQAPALGGRLMPDPCVRIRAADEGVAQLGAVMSYGAIVAPLESVWLATAAREPHRLVSRFGTAVASLANTPARDGTGVVLTCHATHADAEAAGDELSRFDLAVVAEGGVFSDQQGKAVQHDYRQTAWVGQVTLAGAPRGMAFERFTSVGPAALLPLPPLRSSSPEAKVGPDDGPMTRLSVPAAEAGGERRAGLVWCVPSDADAVRGASDEQRLAALNSIFHADTGRVISIGPLKSFPLGLNAERTLTDGRIVRIGNAAQTLHPVAGQGLNLGLRDAFELVTRLARTPSNSTNGTAIGTAIDKAIDIALREVEWSRAPDRWAMIAVTDFLARSFTWQWPGLATARGIALAGLQQVGPMKSFIARQMMFGRR